MPEFAGLQDTVVDYIPHKYWAEMARKSLVVLLYVCSRIVYIKVIRVRKQWGFYYETAHLKV